MKLEERASHGRNISRAYPEERGKEEGDERKKKCYDIEKGEEGKETAASHENLTIYTEQNHRPSSAQVKAPGPNTIRKGMLKQRKR